MRNLILSIKFREQKPIFGAKILENGLLGIYANIISRALRTFQEMKLSIDQLMLKVT